MSAQLERERLAAIDMVAAGQARLEDALATVELDPAAPSRLPGWTIGHVLTHLARNADSHVQMLDGEQQYLGNVQSREADIEAGANRSAGDLAADVARSSQRLMQRWARLETTGDWDGVATFADGTTAPRSALPTYRLREVLIHHIDLDLGDVTFADLPAEFIRRELRRLQMVYNARHSMGMGGLPGPVLELAPHERVAWLMGRRTVDGVADVY